MEKVYLKDYAKKIQQSLNRIRNLENIDKKLINTTERFINYLYGQNYTLARISYYMDKLIKILPEIKHSQT